jgi:hypothetical protein
MTRFAFVAAALLTPFVAFAYAVPEEAPSQNEIKNMRAELQEARRQKLIEAAKAHSDLDDIAAGVLALDREDCEVTDIDFLSPDWQQGECVQAWGFTVQLSCMSDGIPVSASGILTMENLRVLGQGARPRHVAEAAALDAVAYASGQREIWYEINGSLDRFGADICGEQHGWDDNYFTDGDVVAGTSRRGSTAESVWHMEVQKYEIEGEEASTRTGEVETTVLMPRTEKDLPVMFLDEVNKIQDDAYPFSGVLGFEMKQGNLTIEFSEATPETGEAVITFPNGTTETINLPMEEDEAE